MSLRLATLALSVMLLLLACSGEKEESTPGPASLQPGNNSGMIEGDRLGSGLQNVLQLRDPLTLQVVSSHPDLSLGQLYKARTSVDTTDVYWMVSVTNNGDEALSGVSAGGVAYLNAAGQPIEYTGITTVYLYGNVGVTDFGCEHSCLAPGETGWLLGHQDILYGAVASMRFDYIVDGDDTPTQPEAIVRPTDYSVDGDELELEIENTGSWAADIGQQSVYVVLDLDGSPLMWGALPSAVGNLDVLESGEDMDIWGWLPYNGASWTGRFYVDYEDLMEEQASLPTE